MGINLGALIAPLSATWLHDYFGDYNSAFAAAAVGMVFSLAVFEIWKKKYMFADHTRESSGTDGKAEIIDKKKTSKSDSGLIMHREVCKNQRGEILAQIEGTHLVKRKSGSVPVN